MKICIISQYFPPRVIGGGEYAAYMTAACLAKYGHTVHVLTSHPRQSTPSTSGSEIPVHEVKDKITIHRILGVKTVKLASIDLTYFCVNELFFLHAFFAILSFVKTKKPDLIHALNIDSIPPSVLVAKICRIPVVVTINSHVVTCAKGDKLDIKGNVCKNKCSFSLAKHCLFDKLRFRSWRGVLFLETILWWRLLEIFIRYADKVIAVSKYVKATLIQYGVPPKKIEVIPEIADTVLFRKKIYVWTARKELGLSTADKVILYAGAIFDFKKGSEFLLKAMARVIKNIHNTKLIITGFVPNKETKIIDAVGLKDNVVVTGFLARYRVPSIYAAADLVVFPSLWPEPFGLVLLEAMSMGKPIIASKVGGITDIVQNGVNGLLIKPNDVDGLATSIINLLNDTKLRKKLSEAGKKSVERYHEDVVLKKLTTVYQSLKKEATQGSSKSPTNS